MDKFLINGPVVLDGAVTVSGSKNAALPVMAAAILASGETVLEDVPGLSDIVMFSRLLESIGIKVSRDAGNKLCIDAGTVGEPFGDYEIVRKLRASICILGPLLARCGRCEVSMPGGCLIGDRPVDIHLKGLRALGAKIQLRNGYIIAEAPDGLVGADIFLGGAFGSTVLGTANVLMAAVTAKGKTVIEGAACEPEIGDLCRMLSRMGAKISGTGSPRLTIEGVKSLQPVNYKVIPDRIEAGTFMVAAGITAGTLKIQNCCVDDMMAVVDVLRSIGMSIERDGESSIVVSGSRGLCSADITTQPYPGFPTDLQAQLMALLSVAKGNSIITEKIFPDRFMHVAELNRMGAAVRKEGPTAIVAGVEKLIAAPVMASDLRASAALVLAGMAAEGATTINRVYHIDRGYEHIEEKLNAAGADITRQKNPDV